MMLANFPCITTVQPTPTDLQLAARHYRGRHSSNAPMITHARKGKCTFLFGCGQRRAAARVDRTLSTNRLF
jgi:hypothetical protein